MEVSLEDKQVMVCGSERDGDMSAQMEDVHNTNNDVSCVSCHCHIYYNIELYCLHCKKKVNQIATFHV